MMFEFWDEIDPDDAPFVRVIDGGAVPWSADRPEDEDKRRTIHKMLTMLQGEDLDAVLDVAAARFKASMTAFESRLAETMKRLGMKPHPGAPLPKR